MKHFAPLKSFYVIALLYTTTSFATPPAWQIDQTKSTVIFTATQNNAPVSGKFTAFTADVAFSPDQLKESHIIFAIDMNSITTSYSLIADTLKTEAFLDVKKFPKGIFKSSTVTKISNNTYQANGTLILRDKSLPTEIQFTVEKFTPAEAVFSGVTFFKRTSFGIGSGEWSKTSEIKDDISVQFKVFATKK
jgi:polyisoprenoid-binding protein YceI